jgi:cysteine desulfurase/selenocysteine lyase
VSQRIYLDNSATSFPKPPAVHEAMARYATELGASPGRGAYVEARAAGELLQQCRVRINRLINGQSPDHVIFTLNASDALNLAIRGLLRPGDHVITTWMEHNSVLRPLTHLAQVGGIEQTRVRCDPETGLVDPEDMRRAIRRNTRLLAVVHASNVTGTLQPVAELGRIAREHSLLFLIDAAQSAGRVPIDVQALRVDLLAFPGHKGLLGPLGTGALYIRPGVEQELSTVREGGTGSNSEQDVQPDFLPDRFEAGSHNAIGLVGLSEGVSWLLERGVEAIWQHEQSLVATMLDGLGRCPPAVRLFGPKGIAHRCGVFSVRIDGIDQPKTLSDRLEQEYGILTRPGIHCAPLAHRTIGTYDCGGTVRLSFGPFVSEDDVLRATEALAAIGEQPGRA